MTTTEVTIWKGEETGVTVWINEEMGMTIWIHEDKFELISINYIKVIQMISMLDEEGNDCIKNWI